MEIDDEKYRIYFSFSMRTNFLFPFPVHAIIFYVCLSVCVYEIKYFNNTRKLFIIILLKFSGITTPVVPPRSAQLWQ